MIKAEIASGHGCYIARVQGHAGYAPKGQDIVCAGVSALTSALYEALTSTVSRENTEYFSAEVFDGYFEVKVFGVKNAKTENRVNDMLFMFTTGLLQIERQYPDFLEFNSFEFPLRDNDNDTSEQTMKTKREEDKG